MGLLKAAALGSVVVASASAARCDSDASCSYSVNFKGKTYKYDFRPLCNNNADYYAEDDKGHQYYAQICGVTGQSCLPSDFDTYYQYGSALQMWGSAPTCDLTDPTKSCQDKETGADVCCTASCQVVGLPETVSTPSVSLINADDISAGIQVSMVGEQPTAGDPNACSTWDPSTGQPVLRHTNFIFTCDPSVKGFARVVSVAQDEVNDCLYTFTFATATACQYSNSVLALSGGWAFVISMLSIGGAYLLAGAGWQFARTKTIGLPHAAFWGDFNELVVDGLLFAFSRFRKPARGARKGGLATMGNATPDSAPLYGGSSGSAGADGDVSSKAVAFGEL